MSRWKASLSRVSQQDRYAEQKQHRAGLLLLHWSPMTAITQAVFSELPFSLTCPLKQLSSYQFKVAELCYHFVGKNLCGIKLGMQMGYELLKNFNEWSAMESMQVLEKKDR